LATKALIVAVMSVVAGPFLLGFEVVAFVLVAMGTYDYGNPLPGKIASVIAVILMCSVLRAPCPWLFP